MQPISKVLTKVMQKRHIASDKKQLEKVVLSDPEIAAFLKRNVQLSQAQIQSSMATLFAFHQQKEDLKAGKPFIEGYVPELFLNGTVIDMSYKKTAEQKAVDQKRQVARRLQLIDLPESLRQADFKKIDVNDHDGRYDAISAAASYAGGLSKSNRGFYLSGDFGVGKTYLLAAMANRLAQKGVNVIFFHVPTFIASLSDKIQKGTVQDEIMRLSHVSVLILDDIGAETLSPWSRDDVLGVILQQRMDNRLATFFSSNMDMKRLEQHFQETRSATDPVKAKRLMERVNFLSREIVVSGPNRRR